MMRADVDEQLTKHSAQLRQAERTAQQLRSEVALRERSTEAMAEDLRRAHTRTAELEVAQVRPKLARLI